MSEDPLTTDPNAQHFRAPQPDSNMPLPETPVTDEAMFTAARNIVDGAPGEIGQRTAEMPTKNPNVLSKAEWHQVAENSFIEAKRTGKQISIVFADIGAFKAVNDTLGHDEGDRVIEDLKGVFALVSHSFRTQHTSPEDTRPLDVIAEAEYSGTSQITDSANNEPIDTEAGRVGGDEFSILCHTDEAGAKAIKARLERIFGSYMELPNSQKLKELGVNIAVGVSSMQPDDTHVDDIIKRADEAMYEDKLDKLPLLDIDQKAKVLEATRLLKEAGISERDVPKYLKRFERSAAAEPQLPFPDSEPKA